MVEIAPFKALRHTDGKKQADLSDFVCPPYDVISPAARAALVRKSDRNIVRVELPEGEDDARYTDAGRLLETWRNEDHLHQDRHPSFYVLETIYRADDPFAPASNMSRFGVFAALRIEPPGKGDVRPHEKTLSKAKEERLKLLMATKSHISPIFGLFFDEKSAWRTWIKKATQGDPVSTAETPDGKHRLWKIEDAALQTELREMLGGKPLYIADGHHRYEVSWAYKESRFAEDPNADRTRGWHYVMAYICPMEEPGLLMLPTHRLVRTGHSPEEMKTRISKFFTIEPVNTTDQMVKTLLEADPSKRMMGWISAEGLFVLTLTDKISVDLCLAHRPAALWPLDVVLLHDIILDESKGATYIKDQTIFFMQDVNDMAARVKNDPGLSGFVLRSAGVNTLAQVASAGEVMPPKTTYFYPKVPTGFALMPVEQSVE